MQGMNQDSFVSHRCSIVPAPSVENDPGFPASVPTCKELGSHHSHPYKKNTEQINDFFLGPNREMRLQGKLPPLKPGQTSESKASQLNLLILE